MSEDPKDRGTKHMVADDKGTVKGGYQPVQKSYQPRHEERGYQPQSSAAPQGKPPQGGTGTVPDRPAPSSSGSTEKK